MDALLVSVPTGWYPQGPFPSQGLVSIASYLRRAGRQARVLQMSAYVPLGKRRFLQIFQDCLRRTTGFVGFSVTTPQIPMALELSTLAKKWSRLPVVWGGVHPTLLPEQTAAHEAVDVVVVGPGELAAQRILQGERRPVVRGVRLGDDECEIDLTTLIDLSIFTRVYYEPGRRMRPGWALSAGCDDAPWAGADPAHAWRMRPVEHLLRFIRRLRDEFGAEYIRFEDEDPFRDKAAMADLADGLAGMGLEWSAAVRPDDLLGDPDYFARMRRLGWVATRVECFTGSDRLLAALGAGFTSQTLRQAAAALGGIGVFATYTSVTRLPGETDEDRRLTFRLADDLGRIHPRSRVVAPRAARPYPGGRVFELFVEAGFKPPADLEGWRDLLMRPGGWMQATDERLRSGDAAGQSAELHRRVQRQAAAAVPEGCGSVLQVGFGSPEETAELSRRAKYVAVVVPHERLKARVLAHCPGVEAAVAAPDDLACAADASFDCVYVGDLTGACRTPFALLQEIGRVLRPGGKLVLGVRKDGLPASGDPVCPLGCSVAGKDELLDMLTNAGFGEVCIADGEDDELIAEAYRTCSRDGAALSAAAMGC